MPQTNPTPTTDFARDVARCREALIDRLFAMQRADGSWQDTLPSAAVSTGAAVILLHYTDPEGSADLVQAGARWLRDTQAADGGWGDAPGATSTLNATPMAVAAIHYVAPELSREHVARGLACIERFGGMEAVADRERCRLFVACQVALSVAGLYDERKIMRAPAEIIFLPRHFRQKISFLVPLILAWGLMQARMRPFGPIRRAVNRLARPRIMAYFRELHAFQGPRGGYEESPLTAAVVGLGLARARALPEHVAECTDYLRRTVRADGSWAVNRDLETSATTWVAQGMQDAGYARDPRMQKCLDWLRSCQRPEAFGATGCPAGGWGWSLPSGWPDSDDTADAVINLSKFEVERSDPQLRAGLDWLRRMQNRDGSWACFSPNSVVGLDAPCAAMTAHAVEALHHADGLTPSDPTLRRALRWFAKHQADDGSMSCLWYRDSTAGTGMVLESLGQLGLQHEAMAMRCRKWLVAHQNADGGWGDGAGAASTAEETAWALLGLLESDLAPDHPAIRDGVAWLVANQREDGLFEPTILGVYFLELLYSDDLLAAGYALQAIARYHARTAARAHEGAES